MKRRNFLQALGLGAAAAATVPIAALAEQTVGSQSATALTAANGMSATKELAKRADYEPDPGLPSSGRVQNYAKDFGGSLKLGDCGFAVLIPNTAPIRRDLTVYQHHCTWYVDSIEMSAKQAMDAFDWGGGHRSYMVAGPWEIAVSGKLNGTGDVPDNFARRLTADSPGYPGTAFDLLFCVTNADFLSEGASFYARVPHFKLTSFRTDGSFTGVGGLRRITWVYQHPDNQDVRTTLGAPRPHPPFKMAPVGCYATKASETYHTRPADTVRLNRAGDVFDRSNDVIYSARGPSAAGQMNRNCDIIAGYDQLMASYERSVRARAQQKAQQLLASKHQGVAWPRD